MTRLIFFLQNEWVRQNCAVQMERVRENYNWQVQNLREIRHYGTNQVTAVRDQYFEQVIIICSIMHRLHNQTIFLDGSDKRLFNKSTTTFA